MEQTPFFRKIVDQPSICQLHSEVRFRLVSALSALELIGLTTSSAGPLVQLTRDDLLAALEAINDAAEVEAQVTRLLGSPFGAGSQRS